MTKDELESAINTVKNRIASDMVILEGLEQQLAALDVVGWVVVQNSRAEVSVHPIPFNGKVQVETSHVIHSGGRTADESDFFVSWTGYRGLEIGKPLALPHIGVEITVFTDEANAQQRVEHLADVRRAREREAEIARKERAARNTAANAAK